MTRTYKKERRRAPLSAKIFAYFAVFTAFIIVLLWLFQTVFFDAIYGAVKKHDMKNCARSITQVIDEGADTESISDATIAAAKKYNCCIIVYKIQRSNAKMISGAHIQSSCMIHGIDFAANQALFKELYYGAQNGGYCFTKLDLDGVESDKIASPETKDGAGLSSELCSALASVDGADYLVIADSQIVPLSATTRVLTYQLIAITAILFVASVVISLVISHRLSKPLKKMTAEASLLAKGNYDVHFENRGFRESVELGNTLNYAAGELSKLDSMQKELIANISHDLRTPLTMIRGYGEVMRDIPGEMNSENIQIIIDETARLSSLVTDILDLS
ncbi:MAG: HAMP domain-containing histidine kinase, partial [Clostridia bacterium]|nr:HAMP domain-containing histidine kinase [Clostridia bacterium]